MPTYGTFKSIEVDNKRTFLDIKYKNILTRKFKLLSQNLLRRGLAQLVATNLRYPEI